jgi:hypothetical protein
LESTASSSLGVESNSPCIQLWRADRPGTEAGHVSDSSSYFDRMWDRGQQKRRWFLFLKKSSMSG